MYEQKTITNSDLRLFGIKIFEKIQENTDIFEREFLYDEEEQEVLGESTCTVWKIFKIITVKFFDSSANPGGERFI